MTPLLAGLILMLVGCLAMIGSAMNWWIVTRPGKFINRLVGDGIARAIYFGICVITFIKGIELALDVRWLPF